LAQQDSEADKPFGAEGGRLTEALVRARSDQAAHFDAIEEVRAAETARLQVLADDVRPVLAELAGRRDQFALAVVPGNPPRLWIDMLAYVAIGEDGRTYRLLYNGSDGRVTLYETVDRAEMASRMIDYMAHQILDHERHARAALARLLDSPPGGYPGVALALAWICGFAVGVLALFIVGVLVAGAPGA
jgi:hypothetical protein